MSYVISALRPEPRVSIRRLLAALPYPEHVQLFENFLLMNLF